MLCGGHSYCDAAVEGQAEESWAGFKTAVDILRFSCWFWESASIRDVVVAGGVRP